MKEEKNDILEIGREKRLQDEGLGTFPCHQLGSGCSWEGKGNALGKGIRDS